LLVNYWENYIGTGYTIPAGWLVMISPMAIHLNPELYEDPLSFNPWRWQVVGAKFLNNNHPFMHEFLLTNQNSYT
jgi:cytochrome P450